jgi:hypothetical protein
MAGAWSHSQRIFLANKKLIHIPFQSLNPLIVGKAEIYNTCYVKLIWYKY